MTNRKTIVAALTAIALPAAGLSLTALGAAPAFGQPAYNRTIGYAQDDGEAGMDEWVRAQIRCQKAMPIEFDPGLRDPDPRFLDCMYSQGWKVVPPNSPRPGLFEGPYGWHGPHRQRHLINDQDECRKQNSNSRPGFAKCMAALGWTYTPWPIPEVRRPLTNADPKANASKPAKAILPHSPEPDSGIEGLSLGNIMWHVENLDSVPTAVIDSITIGSAKDYPIGAINVSCLTKDANNWPLSAVKQVIRSIIPAKGTATFRNIAMGPINSESDSMECMIWRSWPAR